MGIGIKGIKLTTGDELVAQVVQELSDGALIIRDPLMIVMTVVPKSKDNPEGRFVFYPWTIINQGDIKLRPVGIMAHYPVSKDVETSYQQNVSCTHSGAGVAQILYG